MAHNHQVVGSSPTTATKLKNMQQGAGKNIPNDFPFVWGWKQNFRVILNHINNDGTPREEPLLTNVKFTIYNNKSKLAEVRSFELTANEGITFEESEHRVVIDVDQNTPDILPIASYFYIVEYHRTGLGIELAYSGSFFVTVDGDCNCDPLNYVSTNLEIAQVNGLATALADKIKYINQTIGDGTSDELTIVVADGNFLLKPPLISVFQSNSLYTHIANSTTLIDANTISILFGSIPTLNSIKVAIGYIPLTV